MYAKMLITAVIVWCSLGLLRFINNGYLPTVSLFWKWLNAYPEVSLVLLVSSIAMLLSLNKIKAKEEEKKPGVQWNGILMTLAFPLAILANYLFLKVLTIHFGSLPARLSEFSTYMLNTLILLGALVLIIVTCKS